MSKEKINQALRQLSEALTEEYGTLERGRRRSVHVYINEVETTLLSDSDRRFVYTAHMEVDTTKEEVYGY